jgi:hypothetical protein
LGEEQNKISILKDYLVVATHMLYKWLRHKIGKVKKRPLYYPEA